MITSCSGKRARQQGNDLGNPGFHLKFETELKYSANNGEGSSRRGELGDLEEGFRSSFDTCWR